MSLALMDSCNPMIESLLRDNKKLRAENAALKAENERLITERKRTYEYLESTSPSGFVYEVFREHPTSPGSESLQKDAVSCHSDRECAGFTRQDTSVRCEDCEYLSKLKAELCKYQHTASPEDRKVTRLLTEIERLKAELAEAKKDVDPFRSLRQLDPKGIQAYLDTEE